jgi:hypothetical protein
MVPELLATDGPPTVAAYLTRRRRGFGRFYLVPCPFCGVVHLHGREGRRTADCRGGPEYKPEVCGLRGETARVDPAQLSAQESVT